jgi:hypothetical protein
MNRFTLIGIILIGMNLHALVKGEWDHLDTDSIFLIMLQP